MKISNSGCQKYDLLSVAMVTHWISIKPDWTRQASCYSFSKCAHIRSFLMMVNFFFFNHNFHCQRLISLYSPSFFLFPDRYVLVGSHHDDNSGGGALAIMNQLIAALTEQTKRGWVPNRTTVFCSWGGTALGNIGSYEWGKVSKHESMCLI